MTEPLDPVEQNLIGADVVRHRDRPLDARVERAVWTLSGYLMVFGWMADEGSSEARFVFANELSVVPMTLLTYLRHARPEVAEVFGAVPHNFGYLILAKTAAGVTKPPTDIDLVSNGHSCRIDMTTVAHVSEQRLLEELLAFLSHFQAHGGRESVLSRFLAEDGRDLIADLNSRGQKQAARIQHIERFGGERRGPSVLTVLFGDVDSVMFQPLLFAKAGVAFGEWIYACNSPELADDLIRLSRTASKLYDLPIRVVILSGNAGFGGGNHAAIETASGSDIVLLNPDVYPIPRWSKLLNRALQPDRFAVKLRGGLLFYDDETLMHGGMHLEEDVFFAHGLNGRDGASCRLLRVEHYDKGVPFIAADWPQARPVTAVTGAVMAFRRQAFESIGGFSSDFVYGHYEDADLSLRWADHVGPVEVDPDIRLIHLEGQGSKTRLPHFHGAALVNRHVFDTRARSLGQRPQTSDVPSA